MSRDDMNDLLMGVAVVALGYAVYRSFKKPEAARPAARNTGVVGPQGPRLEQPRPTYTGSPFTSLTDLLRGTTQDIGAFQGRNYLNEISDPMLRGGDRPRDSIHLDTPW